MSAEDFKPWSSQQATSASSDEVAQYINDRINDYKDFDLNGTELWSMFSEDFAFFTATVFKTDTQTTASLRDFLRKNGVFVPKSRRPIGNELFDLLREELDWPINEKDRPAHLASTSSSIARTSHNPTPDHPVQRRDDTYPKLTNLAKMYSNDQKFGGDAAESFNLKYNIFRDLCERVELPESALAKALPTMLKDAALMFYYSSIDQETRTSHQDTKRAIQSFFGGQDSEDATLIQWHNISFLKIIEENPKEELTTCFQKLVTKLRETMFGLALALRTEDFFRAKVLATCREHEACTVACSVITKDSGSMLNNLRASIATWETKNGRKIAQYPGTEQMFTDRRYHRNQPQSSHQNKRCFVCRKEGCWSSKHTQEERDKARQHYKRRLDRKFDQRFSQLVTEFEGLDHPSDDDSDDATDRLETLLIDQETEKEVYLTSFGNLEPSAASSLTLKLCDKSARHALTKEVTSNPELKDPGPDVFLSETRYGAQNFQGILIDSGAAGMSSAGYRQVLAYEKVFGKTILDKSRQGELKATFGIGSTTSIGAITINTPIGNIVFHVVDVDTPLLLCLEDMDRSGVFLNNIQNKLVCKDLPDIPVVRRFGHAFLIWGPMLHTTNHCFLSDLELKRLHRRFGHPSVARLSRLLERAGHDDPQHRKTIQHITEHCEKCQRFGDSPRRFKFSLRDDTIDFNHCIFVDVMYIDSAPVLHIVDEATRFQAAKWLQNMSAQHVWETLRTCWIDVYLGPPDIIQHDAGTNFTAATFQQNASSLAIKTKEAPVEAANSIGLIERYHKPLRRAYEVISDEFARSCEGGPAAGRKVLILQMAVKTVNDTAGPDGLVPTLLVFGAYPRMSELDPPAPSIAHRARAIKRAMDEVTKLRARQQLRDALRVRNGPSPEVENLPLGSDVLVWRVHSKQWEGPYKLLATEDELVTVETPRGTAKFRSTSVKRYDGNSQQDIQANRPNLSSNDPSIGEHTEMLGNHDGDAYDGPRRNPSRQHRRPLRYSQYTISPTPNFTQSRMAELEGLLQRGVFQVVPLTAVPPKTRVFGSRFVDTIKFEGTPKAFEKSRLVVQAFKDDKKDQVLTQSPTIQRSSQRLLLSLALTLGLSIHVRDISQAYTQSTTSLIRPFYVRAPVEMNLSRNLVLKIARPLYGIPEAGTHWFSTYHAHHIQKLMMTTSAYDTCLLLKGDQAIVGLQIDDTLIACNEQFKQCEAMELEKANFTSKPLDDLKENSSIMFNGAKIALKDSVITVTQIKQIEKLAKVDASSPTYEQDYIAQRARGAYISTTCHPQVTFGLSYAAQHTRAPTEENVKELNKCIGWQIENANQGLRFIRLARSELKLIVFTDSSFANNKDYSSQLGFVIVLADNNHCNLIHWSSIKCKRVTRSVLASELYAMQHGFDSACVMKQTLETSLGATIPLIICIDSFSLYECLVKLGTTLEKRLMIDLLAIRQSYERREIAEIRWIEGSKNAADALTKRKGNKVLDDIILHNKVDATASGWVERKDSTKGMGHV